MPDSKKAKDKAQTEETAQSQAEEISQGEEVKEDAANQAPASPLPGQVTLSKAHLERLRRRLKAQYH
jgi:hypothetical protein